MRFGKERKLVSLDLGSLLKNQSAVRHAELSLCCFGNQTMMESVYCPEFN